MDPDLKQVWFKGFMCARINGRVPLGELWASYPPGGHGVEPMQFGVRVLIWSCNQGSNWRLTEKLDDSLGGTNCSVPAWKTEG